MKWSVVWYPLPAQFRRRDVPLPTVGAVRCDHTYSIALHVRCEEHMEGVGADSAEQEIALSPNLYSLEL